jgi:hypothetical protein
VGAERNASAEVFFFTWDVELAPFRTRGDDQGFGFDKFTALEMQSSSSLGFNLFYAAVFENLNRIVEVLRYR